MKNKNYKNKGDQARKINKSEVSIVKKLKN
jgi:hypothetical protein